MLKESKQWEAVGGLSTTTKMPCFSYSLPIKYCKTGQFLRKVKGSVCRVCYARKGNYGYKRTQAALERRYNSLKDPKWAENMIWLMKHQSYDYFRWQDAGDLQDEKHLRNICVVAEECADMKFWLPTREVGILAKYGRKHTFPENLIVRVSAPFINKPINASHSSVVIDENVNLPEGATPCNAPENGGECLRCRNCWDKNIKMIAFLKH